MLEQVGAIGGCQWAAEQARITPPPIMPKILYLVTEELPSLIAAAMALSPICASPPKRGGLSSKRAKLRFQRGLACVPAQSEATRNNADVV
jgi:hypothetical protein